jgi:hypothetical protein
VFQENVYFRSGRELGYGRSRPRLELDRLPSPETNEELRSAKWGLLLVERVADDWGRISEGGMWAELQLETP